MAGGEQSATQPVALLQLAKSPVDPDEELELEELELVVPPELEEPVIAPELLVIAPELLVPPELLPDPPAPPVPLPLLEEVVAPAPVPVPWGSLPVLAQAQASGTRAARVARRRFMRGQI